jgi:hypothetical protein
MATEKTNKALKSFVSETEEKAAKKITLESCVREDAGAWEALGEHSLTMDIYDRNEDDEDIAHDEEKPILGFE